MHILIIQKEDGKLKLRHNGGGSEGGAGVAEDYPHFCRIINNFLLFLKGISF